MRRCLQDGAVRRLHYSLGDLSHRLDAQLHGERDAEVSRIDSLARATSESLCFYADKNYREALATTRAGAVILAPADLERCPVAALVSENPYLAYARAARLLHPPAEPAPGRHPSAVIADSARIDPTAHIGPTAVVEDDVEIGPRVYVGPGCIVGAHCRVGEDSRLVARVTLCAGSRIGRRALIHPGAVIGRDGFGFAKDGDRWERIPQLGGVRLGDDVEIGANTCVDRGALEDTEVADGVKLDSLIQIGHNCHIGENTAMAACSGISGSTRIGRNCTIAGAVGMAGHLTIADGVHFTGMAMVTRSFPEAGVYSSGVPAMPNAEWRRNAARFRRLDELVKRVKQLEVELRQEKHNPDEEQG
jgi:UDP-3-O-[3-hydroxymyristoyl] glucosamine N-acyltransferase